MKQRVPSAIYSKEFREQAVKQVTEEGLSGAAFVDVCFHIGVLVKGRTDRKVGRCRQDTTPADRD